MASKVVTIRIDGAVHDRYRLHARASGLAFNAWAKLALADQYKLENALEGDAEQKRAERRLLKKAASPQGHGFTIPATDFLSSGKKSYEPDLK